MWSLRRIFQLTLLSERRRHPIQFSSDISQSLEKNNTTWHFFAKISNRLKIIIVFVIFKRSCSQLRSIDNEKIPLSFHFQPLFFVTVESQHVERLAWNLFINRLHCKVSRCLWGSVNEHHCRRVAGGPFDLRGTLAGPYSPFASRLFPRILQDPRSKDLAVLLPPSSPGPVSLSFSL